MPGRFSNRKSYFAGRAWSTLLGVELDETFDDLVLSSNATQGIPGDPTTVQAGVEADPGTIGGPTPPALEDHVHDVETAAPSHPTGTTASEGIGSALMRADATVQQGIVTTKGDILGYSTVPSRVPVGADGEVLTADSGDPLGLSWQPAVAPPAYELADLEYLSWVL